MYSFKVSDDIYDWTSCLEKDKLYFGPFPNQIMIDKLLEEKFDIIVNLTMEDENIYSDSFQEDIYKIPKNKYIAYPIKDNNIPEYPMSYCSFICTLNKLYKENKKMYIHCRGGHGRSGMVSVSLLLTIFPNKNIKEIIEFVNKCHTERIVLRDRWKYKSTPFNYPQYIFILKIHKDIYINNNNKYYNWLIFNDSIIHNDVKFDTLYKLYIDTELEEKDKLETIKTYFIDKIKNNKDVECKFYLTYLRNIIITDCPNKEFCETYSNILYDIRSNYFLSI